jgi:hypothetical protein
MTAQGGRHGANVSPTLAESGRIRIEAYERSFTGAITGRSRSVTLSPTTIIQPPTSSPSLRVTLAAGVPVPANPRGSFINPDVTLDEPDPVTLDIEARNVAPGTVVTLTVVNETDPVQTIASTPLAGTFELSSATVQVRFPHGFTRVFTQATINP